MGATQMAAAETSMLVAADNVQGATICNDTTGDKPGSIRC